MSPPIIVDTGGLLRALARTPRLQPSFPEYQAVLTTASLVIVPALVLAEVDYFLRAQRAAMRKLVAEIFDPGTRYRSSYLSLQIWCGLWNSTPGSRTSVLDWSTALSPLLPSGARSTEF